jgi:leucyl aminopeptidase
MKFQIKDIKLRPTVETLVLTYFIKEKPETHPLWKQLKAADKRQVQRLFKSHEFAGKENQVKVLWRTPKGKILLLGLGEKAKWNSRKLILVARHVVALARSEKTPSFALALEYLATAGQSIERLAQTVVENAVMADYEFLNYKEKTEDNFKINLFTLLVDKLAVKGVGVGVKIGQVIGEQVNDARELGNIPGGEMTPTLLSQKAQIAGRDHGFKVKVFGRSEMKKLKMGAILGVAHGSAEEPKFIIMEYWGADKKIAPYVFVGKGVTFDTGGLNLKPENAMSDMHLDMAGGAAVISAMGTVAKLKLPVNVVGLVPAVENMPGSAGYRPGDLLRSMSGKSIEVLNTDAEGRIILADALTYAEHFNPKLVVDVATLTGACMVALGLKYSGLMTPDEELRSRLQELGEISGDYVWPLPIGEEFEEEIKGTFGDIQNVGKTRYAGAITAATFLWQFAKHYKWAHLDIAGPMKTVEGQYLSKGASGVGVRFLVELVRN